MKGDVNTGSYKVGDLLFGSVFAYRGTVYIKIVDVRHDIVQYSRAVDLDTGLPTVLDNYTQVTRLPYALVLSKEEK